MVVTGKAPRMTYFLEVEREGNTSDHSCDCTGSRDDTHTGGGEGGKTSGHGCNYKGSRDNIQSGGGEGGARGQIMVATAIVAGMTYRLEVEREGKRSDHSCNHKGNKDDIQSGGGEWWQDVR